MIFKIIFYVLLFILLLILLHLLYVYWMYPKYLQPDFYRLQFVFGPKGTGKTTFVVSDGLKYYKKGKKVYSNIKTPFFHYFDSNDLEKQKPDENSVVYWDEISLDHDNRDFKNFSKDLKEILRLQRHFKFRLVCLSQTYDADKKIRDQAQDIFILRRIACWTVILPVKKSITVENDLNTGSGRIVEKYKFKSIFSYRFIFLPKYRFYYDSFDTDSFTGRESLNAVYCEPNEMQLKMINKKEYKKNVFKRFIRLRKKGVKLYV